MSHWSDTLPHFLTVSLFCFPFPFSSHFLLSRPPLITHLSSCRPVCLLPPVFYLSSSLLQNLPQVKQVQALRQVKERLQAENRALARVVAKLSQSACSQLPTADL